MHKKNGLFSFSFHYLCVWGCAKINERTPVQNMRRPMFGYVMRRRHRSSLLWILSFFSLLAVVLVLLVMRPFLASEADRPHRTLGPRSRASGRTIGRPLSKKGLLECGIALVPFPNGPITLTRSNNIWPLSSLPSQQHRDISVIHGLLRDCNPLLMDAVNDEMCQATFVCPFDDTSSKALTKQFFAANYPRSISEDWGGVAQISTVNFVERLHYDDATCTIVTAPGANDSKPSARVYPS